MIFAAHTTCNFHVYTVTAFDIVMSQVVMLLPCVLNAHHTLNHAGANPLLTNKFGETVIKAISQKRGRERILAILTGAAEAGAASTARPA